ncbi:hypothetical protein [Gottfriedia solisilvae]|uniref:hypothetical protein n=1 Tax=Gottfriedia solisilvae TaxID=1516104 RepID=UPI003D2EC371
MKMKVLISAVISLSVLIGITATTATTNAMDSTNTKNDLFNNALNQTLNQQKYEVEVTYPMSGEDYKTPSTVLWKVDENLGILNLNSFPLENIGINQLENDGFYLGNHSKFQKIDIGKTAFIEKKDQMLDDIHNFRTFPNHFKKYIESEKDLSVEKEGEITYYSLTVPKEKATQILKNDVVKEWYDEWRSLEKTDFDQAILEETSTSKKAEYSKKYKKILESIQNEEQYTEFKDVSLKYGIKDGFLVSYEEVFSVVNNGDATPVKYDVSYIHFNGEVNLSKLND